MSDVMLKIKNLEKSYDIVRALRGVNIEVSKGEIRGLIGENGSGKSTVSYIISGMQKTDSGTMTFMGEIYEPKDAIDAGKKGIAMVVQEMGTISGISVAENIFVGKEDLFTKCGVVKRKKMNKEAARILEALGIRNINPNKLIDAYTFEERKLIEIARAMYESPKLLIIDETTTALSHKGRDVLYRLMDQMAKEGKAVLFISHDLEELMEHCNVLTILRDGEIIDHLTKEKYESNVIKKLMVGREIEGDYYRADHTCTYDEEIVLEMKHVTNDVVFDINFKLHRGEILGFSGLSESGIHDIGRLAFGINKPVYGEVTLPSKGKKVKDSRRSMEAGVGYVSKNRDRESLILEDSIRNNIAINAYDLLKSGIIISPKKEKRYVDEQVNTLRIKCSSSEQYVSTLSGGNKQKVAFGRWIGMDADVLILDCPTRGVDIGVKSAMYQLMTKLKKEGKSILIISEELSEVIGMCDRVLVVRDGQISGEMRRDEAMTEQSIIEYMI